MARKKKSKAAAASGTNRSNASASKQQQDDEKAISVAIESKVIQEDRMVDGGGGGGGSNPFLVGAIDQGTSSTRFMLFTKKTGRVAGSAQMEHPQIYDRPGWHEHDPMVLWQNTVLCMTAVAKALREQTEDHLELDTKTLAAIGITNQRETTIAWNRKTGKPYYNAIVWDDTRTAVIAEDIIEKNHDGAKKLTTATGLPISSYFAGTKVKWLLDNVEALRKDVQEKPQEVCFGTVDTWLLFQLTGSIPKSETTGRKLKGNQVSNVGGSFLTDVTNASRWLFMNIETCTWDATCIQNVVSPHALPMETLPEICPSSHLFGAIADCGLPANFQNVPLAAVLGDQQAALFGQAAHSAGHAKNTYGTGLFLMMNTGPTIVRSQHGLLTTVAYQIETDGKVHYALEGSVSHSGSTIQWLRDQLKMIASAPESETFAKTTSSNDGLYLVPAFAGLFAPHWRSDARACIVGMTSSHHRGHICRAALEAAAYQTREVFDAIVKDTSSNGAEGLKSLSVDGGGTNNKLLMQFQADMIKVPVVKPVVMETTSTGAAFAAGLAVGVWKDLEEIQKLWAVAETFEPKMSDSLRDKNFAGWKKAVTKSLGWVGGHAEEDEPTEKVVATAIAPNGGSMSKTAEAEPTTQEEKKESNEALFTPREVVGTARQDKECHSEAETSPEAMLTAKSDEDDFAEELPSSTNNMMSKDFRVETENTTIVHVGEINEVSPLGRTPRENGPPDASNAVNSFLKSSYNGQTMVLAAGVALSLGLLMGSARKS